MKKYQIAIYIRLSKEDDKLKEESNSVAMQRVLLQKYAAENFTDYELHEFCDDGYTRHEFPASGNGDDAGEDKERGNLLCHSKGFFKICKRLY